MGRVSECKEKSIEVILLINQNRSKTRFLFLKAHLSVVSEDKTRFYLKVMLPNVNYKTKPGCMLQIKINQSNKHTTEIIPTFWNTGDTLSCEIWWRQTQPLRLHNNIICITGFKHLKQDCESLQDHYRRSKIKPRFSSRSNVL